MWVYIKSPDTEVELIVIGRFYNVKVLPCVHGIDKDTKGLSPQQHFPTEWLSEKTFRPLTTVQPV